MATLPAGSTSGSAGVNGQTQAVSVGDSVSFWDVGAYKKCIDRVDYGYKMTNLLIEMVEDRAKIEAQYAKSLRHFSEKWQKVIDGGIVYGSHKEAWMSFSVEADSTAALHSSLADTLIGRDANSAISMIKSWQKQAYHKNTLTGALKESKDLEGMFQRAQRQYAKRYAKVEDARRTYHKAAASLRAAEQRVEQSKVDGTTEAALRVKQEKLARTEHEAIQTREAYHASLRDVDVIKADYVDKMTQAFAVAQEFERTRLNFIADVLAKLTSNLDRRAWSSSIASIADTQRDRVALAKANVSGDLRWFSEVYGSDSSCNWQQYEEYDPTANVRRSSTLPLLTGGPRIVSAASTATDRTSQAPTITSAPTLVGHRRLGERPVSAISTSAYSDGDAGANAVANGNGNGENADVTQYENAAAASEAYSSGVVRLARAKFDYNANAADELTLRAGDTLEIYDEEPIDGWSRGRKDGVDGFFPTSYADPVDGENL